MAILFLTLIWGSCQKKTEAPQTPATSIDTRSPELTGNYEKEWRHYRTMLNDTTLVPLPSCSEDDIYFFDISGNFKYDPSRDLCDSAEVEQPGFWQLESDKTILRLTYPNGYKVQYKILELTIGSLILQVGAFDSTGSFLGLQDYYFTPY